MPFHAELKRRINSYFDQQGKKSTGNWRLWSKAAFLITAHIALYVTLVFFTPMTWLALPLCVVFGMTTAGIGFNIMHDGGHGSFSENKYLNRFAAITLDCLGASSYMWNVKHNIGHHTFTNIEGADEDIDIHPFFRMSDDQKWLRFHRFQHLYWVVLYGMLYFLWVFFLDFRKYYRGYIGVINIPKMSWSDKLLFWGSKIMWVTLYLAVPFYTVGVVATLIGCSVYLFVTGLLVSVVFQLAHIVEHTEFPTMDQHGNIEEEWAVHQLQTTANFGTRSRLLTWFAGGLNFQVEHHLFPKISHIHYPQISKIIRQTCEEYGIVYNEYPRMSSALLSHIRTLRRFGRPTTA